MGWSRHRRPRAGHVEALLATMPEAAGGASVSQPSPSNCWFGVRRRRANDLDYVAVGKDGGSNFAFEYGSMAMPYFADNLACMVDNLACLEAREGADGAADERYAGTFGDDARRRLLPLLPQTRTDLPAVTSIWLI